MKDLRLCMDKHAGWWRSRSQGRHRQLLKAGPGEYYMDTYQAAHELSDRHAHGDQRVEIPTLLVDMMVVSSAAIASVVAGALGRGELHATTAQEGGNP